MRDALASESYGWIAVSWRYTVQSKELDECAPERLTHWTGRGQMVLRWSLTPHKGHTMSDVQRVWCARISDVCNTALGSVAML